MNVRITAAVTGVVLLAVGLAGCADSSQATVGTSTTDPGTSATPQDPEALLPPSQPLTPAVLATTDAGWLVARLDVVADNSAATESIGMEGMYLIDPAGGLYRIDDLPFADLELFQWLPGTALALGIRNTGATQTVVLADLEAGTTTTVDLARIAADAGLTGVEAEVTFADDGTTDLLVSMAGDGAGLSERLTRDGTVTTSTDGPALLRPTPDGRNLLDERADAPRWVDPQTLRAGAPVQLPDSSCRLGRWVGRTGAVLADCPSGWYVASPDAATWKLPLTSDRGKVSAVLGYPDGSVLVRAPQPERVTATTATAVDLPLATDLWVHGTVVAGSQEGGPGEGGPGHALIAWDAADGAMTTLLPGAAAPSAQSVTVVGGPGQVPETRLAIDGNGALARDYRQG